MAAPDPDREVAHFAVKPAIFDRLVGYLEGQRIRDALGLYNSTLQTSTPVYVDELPEPKQVEIPKVPGELKGKGKITDTDEPGDGEDPKIDNDSEESAE